MSASELPQKLPANPLRNWQQAWAEPCDRLCCHCHLEICPCADICCDGCGISIVRPDGATTADMRGLEPSTRLVCLDCPVDLDYDADHWGTHLCETCFASSRVPHFGDGGQPHMRWLRISPQGVHSIEPSRPAMEGAVVAEVTRDDLLVHELGAAATGDDCCPACYCHELEEDNPPANLPGCTDPSHRCCVQGCLDRLRAAGRLTFVRGEDGLPPASYFCQGCHEAEMRKITTGAVLRELEMLLFDGLDLQAAVAQLKAAHALKPGDPSVNTHLHEALDQRMRELCGC